MLPEPSKPLLNAENLAQWLGPEARRGQTLIDAFEAWRPRERGSAVLVCAPDRLAFLIGVLVLLRHGATVILGNPQWAENEWRQLRSLFPPMPVFDGTLEDLDMTATSGPWTGPLLPRRLAGRLLIPTGGSSGELRFAVHTIATLDAAADGYRRFFGAERIDCACPLPVHHIAGFMCAWRSLRTGGKFTLLNPKNPTNFEALRNVHLSLVGKQWQAWTGDRAVRRAMADAAAVLVGAGAPPSHAAAEAQQEGISLWFSYGLTEAGATVALADAGAGSEAPARPLPHLDVQVSESEIHLQGPSMAEGYWEKSEGREPRFRALPIPFPTGDLAEPVEGGLRILGRRDRVIISGGEKTHPAEVEQALRETGLVADAAIVALADPDWGSVAACAFVPANGPVDGNTLKQALQLKLAPWKLPKHWRAVDELPRSSMGKLALPRLRALFETSDQAPAKGAPGGAGNGNAS
ncbi:MAG: AMP-binding protein [Opitutales bacterium]